MRLLLQYPNKIAKKINLADSVTWSHTIIHCTTGQSSSSEQLPLKLSFVSYEDTLSRNVSSAQSSFSPESAPPLLVLHGLFGSKANWHSLCKAMQLKTRPPRKILAVDSRNHGESPHHSEHTYEAMVADVRHLIQEERLGDRVCFLGHSMGGRTAMTFALRYPQLVERLIVADISPVSTPASMNPMAKYFVAMQQVRLPQGVPLSVARQQADTSLASVVPHRGVRSFLLTNLVQTPDGSFRWRINLHALRSNYANISNFPSFGSRSSFLGPTTFIVGGSSDYVTTDDHPRIRKLFPKVEFYTIPDAGHWLHSEKPQDFLQIVLEVLNRDDVKKQ